MTSLGEFLRHRRELLLPEDVGFAPGPKRRTPGLRREEIALLVSISPDYYARLEQGRATGLSAGLLAALARALRLTEDERDYLFRLAGHEPPPRTSVHAHVDPAVLFLLDALGETPAQVVDELLTIVAQNRGAAGLLGRLTGLPGYASNATWAWFADPASRELNDPAEHAAIGRAYAADLRAGLARRPPDDPYGKGMVSDLLRRSAEFRDLWREHQVAPLVSARKRMLHPRAGVLDLQCDVVLSPATGHRLVIFRPSPGSGAAEKLSFLSVVGPS
ncbi:helix-turn-helix domain-containing protein [Actinoplanes sp. LDG1-06]|uniref:Helix-turn-helix domain-containing protein n=1 Tax=Paractinoplanes ovalisporus TaxID=2810368 RepID=A0ABS2A7R3_9ACTN|nr:helix-turn-helix domain-containing protein [Actinoplanes ovalisporus]MBM2615885.1 helix-turn-helix domain-containing protein [Actinoplanes ovalisporus]